MREKEIKVKVNTVIITDRATGKAYRVRTVRSAEDIAGYVNESEKEEALAVLESAVYDSIGKH